MDQQQSSSDPQSDPPRYLQPPFAASSNLGHQSQAKEQASSPDLQFYHFVTMPSGERGQSPNLSSFSRGSSSQAPQGSRLAVPPIYPVDGVNRVPPADPAFLATRLLPAPHHSPQITPHVDTRIAPLVDPEGPFQAASQAAPQATSQAAPQATSQAAPQATLQVAPQATMQVAPQSASSNTTLTDTDPWVDPPASSGSPSATQSQELISQGAASTFVNPTNLLTHTGKISKTATPKRPAAPVDKTTKRSKLQSSGSCEPSTTDKAGSSAKGEELLTKLRAELKPKPKELKLISVQFIDVVAHTAKCDECNSRNKNGMSRCWECGWQICNNCIPKRGGDRSHASVRGTHVPHEDTERLAAARGIEPEPLPLLNAGRSFASRSSEDTVVHSPSHAPLAGIPTAPYLGQDTTVTSPSCLPTWGAFDKTSFPKSPSTKPTIKPDKKARPAKKTRAKDKTCAKDKTSKVADPFIQQGLPSSTLNASAGTQTDGPARMISGWTVYTQLDTANHSDSGMSLPPMNSCFEYDSKMDLDEESESSPLSSPISGSDPTFHDLDRRVVDRAEQAEREQAAYALLGLSYQQTFPRQDLSGQILNPQDFPDSEEFRDVRRNPSRKARPIDMKV